MELLEMYHNVKLQISEDDSILIDYDLFFDDQKENCKGFVIDEEDELEKVLYVLSKLKKQFVDSTVYVCAYGEEIINNKGEEIIYADSLWIHTKESVNNLVSFFEELDSLEPSAIFPLSETEDYFQKKILLFQSTGDIVNLKDKVNESFMKDIKCIYWD